MIRVPKNVKQMTFFARVLALVLFSPQFLRAKNTLELPMHATELRWGVRDFNTNHCCPRNSLKNHPCWRWNTTANLQFTCFFVLCFCVSFCSMTEQSRWKNLSGWHNCSLVRCCFRIFSIPSLIFFAVFSNLSLCREVNVFPIEQKCDSHLIELLQLPGSYLAWKPANFSRVSCRFVPPMEPSCLDVSVWISSINLICNCAKVWKEGAFVFPFVVFLVYGRKHLKNALNVVV